MVNVANVASEIPMYRAHFFVKMPMIGFPTANNNKALLVIIHALAVSADMNNDTVKASNNKHTP